MSDNETRQKLIDSAKKEFFENGFAKASLRKICTNAGVTTGALYFFFKNKDDLFSAIVAPPLLKLIFNAPRLLVRRTHILLVLTVMLNQHFFQL